MFQVVAQFAFTGITATSRHDASVDTSDLELITQESNGSAKANLEIEAEARRLQNQIMIENTSLKQVRIFWIYSSYVVLIIHECHLTLNQ